MALILERHVVDRARNRERCPAGPPGMIGLMLRRAPEGHDRVADILVQGAAFGLDALADALEMIVEHVRHIARRHVLRHGGEADDVGEHHRQFHLGGLHREVLALGDEPADQRLRHVGFEPAQPLQHAVEGDRLVVQLPDARARQGGDVGEFEPADPFGGCGQGADRAGNITGQQNGADDRQAEDPEPCHDRCEQTADLVVEIVERRIDADMPGDVAELGVDPRQDQVGRVGHVDFPERDVVELGNVFGPDGVELPDHRVLQVAQGQQRRLIAERSVGCVALEFGVGENGRLAVQDEPGHLELPAGPGDEFRQLAD